MHEIQQKILFTVKRRALPKKLTLRAIGNIIEEKSAQKIQHHLNQLEKKGFLIIARQNGKITSINKSVQKKSNSILSIPILGQANCGTACQIAEENNFDGYLRISSKLLDQASNVFAVKATGKSLNRANINNKSVDEGDYVIIDRQQKDNIKNGDYVLSVIDGMANIKKIIFDNDNNQIVLLSESTQKHDPIFIHQEDNYVIAGKAIQVIKIPKY